GVLEDSPGDGASLGALQGIAFEEEDWPGLLAIYETRKDLEHEAAGRISVMFDIAALCRDHLNDLDKASATAEEILGIDPSNEEAIALLDELYSVQEKWSDLLRILEAAGNLARDDAARVSLLLRMAELQEQKLSNPDGMVELLDVVLRIDPLCERAVDMLERNIEGEVALRVLDLLEAFTRRTARWERLIELLSLRKGFVDDSYTQLGIQKEIARVYEEELANLTEAFANARVALAMSPEDEEVLTRLLLLAENLGNFDELYLVLDDETRGMADSPQRTQMWRVQATVARDKLGNGDIAIACFRKVMDAQPEDLEAVEALAALYRAAEKPADLVGVLAVQTGLVQDIEERKALFMEMGAVYYGELSLPDKAVAAYEQILQLSHDDPTALENLERLYFETGRFEELEQVLQRRASLSTDPAERKGLLLRRADTLENRLERLEEAFDVLNGLFSEDPLDIDLVLGLETLHGKREGGLSLLDILRRKLELLQDDEHYPVLMKIASVYSERLTDVHQAVETYRKALLRFPSEGATLDELERIVLTFEEKREAYSVLRPLLEERADWERLLVIMEAYKASLDDPESRLQVILEMAGIAEERLVAMERAFDLAAQALALAPGREGVMDLLERVARKAGMLEQAVDAYASIAGAGDGGPEAVAMLMRKARILKDELQDFERAVKEYQGLAELGVDRRVLEALDELYSLLERWSDLAGVLREEFELAVSLDEKLLFLFRLADVFEERLDDAVKACEVIREAHLLDTTREDTLAHLRRLFDERVPDAEAAELLEHWYSANERFEDVAAVLERRFALTEGGADKLELSQKLINVFLAKLGDKRKGLHYAGEALVLGPEDYASMDQLLRLCGETGMAEETVAFLQLARAHAEEIEAYRNLGMEAAHLLTSIDRAEDAEQTLKEVIERAEAFLPAWKALEALFESLGRLQDHEQVLVRLIELTEYDDERIPLLLKLGRLRRDNLDTPETAIEAFGRVVGLDERNEEALNSLAALYESGGLFDKLAEILTSMADLASEPQERISLLVRLALLYEEKLTDVGKAVSTWLNVLDWSPNDSMVLANLQRLYEFQEEWGSFVEMAEREAVLKDALEDRRIALRRSIARVSLKHLDDAMQAQQNWENIVEVRPEDEEACAELRVLYRRNEDFIKLALLLERLASNPQTFSEQRVELWVELGKLKMDEAMDPEGAIRAWRQVLDLAPSRLDAFEALERLYLESARFEDVVGLLERKLELLTEIAERIALLDTMATVLEESLGRWEAAASTRLRILDLDPSLLQQYRRVADIFEAQQQWQSLSEVLLRRLEVEQDSAERILVLTRLAELYEDRLSDDRAALASTRQALELAPGDVDLLDRGERIAGRSELWEELREMWISTVPHLEDERRQTTMLKLGALLRDKLGRFEEAIAWFVKVVEENAEEEQALSSLVELYELVEDWPHLAESLARLAEVTGDFNRQIALYLRLGDVRFGKLTDHAAAQAAYNQVLELDPTEEKAVNALQTLYSETENWEKLVEILSVRASLPPDEDAQLKLIAGELLENRLGKPLDAAQLYDEIVTYDPTVAEAFARLERIYTEHEVWDQLVEAYEKRLSVTGEADKRMDILRRLALLNESVLTNGEAAADFYQQILDIKADDREALNALERLYEEQGRFDDLVLVLRRAVQLAETVREKVVYLEKVATICVEKLQDITSAIMAYREILENDPAHHDTLLRLEDLFSTEGDWMEVLKILELRQKIARDATEVVGFYLRKGDIYRDELLMPDRAREQYHMVLERIPDHVDAIERLLALYEEEEHWEKIIELLLAQARSVQDEERKARIFARMGLYMKDKLENLDGAIELFEAALERVPSLVEAVEPLADIYMAREQWEKAFPLLEMQRQLLEQTAPASELAALYCKVAKVSLSTGSRTKALEYFRKAYDMDPSDVETLDGLASLNFQQGNYEVAEAYYKGLLDRAGDSLDHNRRNAIFRSLGEIEMHLGHVESARDYFAKVLELQPRDRDCLLDLANLMEQHGDWEESVRYRRQVVNLLDDPMERWKALIGIGDVYREKMGNVDLAIRAYNEALETQPYAKGALVKLLEIHINLKAYNEAINVLQHLVQVEDNPQKKAAFTFTIATIYREELKEPEMATDYYEQTLDLHSEKFEAFRAIDEILTERKEWESLEAAYRKMIGRIRGKGLKQVEFALYKALGEIYRSRLRKPDMATSCFELAGKLNIEDVAVHEILAQLYELQGMDEKAVAEHRSLVTLEPERIDSYRTMAFLFRRMHLEDDAWFALSVLAMTNKLNDEEKEFFRSRRTPNLPIPRRSLDQTLWVRYVFSRAESVHVGEVFQTLYQAIGTYLEGRDPKELGLKKKDELDLSQKTIFTAVFNRVSQLLGIPAPKVYLSDRSFGIRLEATVPPVLIIGKDMLHGKSEKELAFLIAKNLTYFHPMHVLAACYPAPVLKQFYQVALKHVQPGVQVDGGDSEQFKVLMQHLQKRISPQLATTLANSINHFYSKGTRPGVSRWLTGVELTANHAGLLACLDLEVAASVLRQESIAFSKLPPREKAKELVLYAISEEFADAREAMSLKLS
ncbi:MAG: tetratricopeptide repeat protein, partial [Deltaproteobacteria bacterium]|nr:tetratricopeptide repeat protein [Deltaproteobacteria bacterium]